MENALVFLRKLVALALLVLVYLITQDFVPFLISIPILLLVFGLIASRILHAQPKELYNFQRSEKYFAQGGLRDLVRIPTMLMAFVYDILVWVVWGLYQIVLLFTDLIYLVKEGLFFILQLIIKLLRTLWPTWRILFKLVLFYFIKWPWWIYRYAYKSVGKTFRINLLKTSAIGAFIALFVFQLFYFISIITETPGLYYIGIVLSILPITWVFGEIASIRGQELLDAPFSQIRAKFHNGMESVRSLVLFISFFVFLVLAQTGLSMLGWIQGSGIIFLGLSINISFLVNVILLFVAVLILFSSFVLPTYRLYNSFSETSLKDLAQLLSYILRRCFQQASGIIPSVIFSIISIIPVSLLVILATFATLKVKENISEIKIDQLMLKQSKTSDQIEEHRIGQEINLMKQVATFPRQFFQDINHRGLISNEIIQYQNLKKQYLIELAINQEKANQEIESLKEVLRQEQNKLALNQTRVEEVEQKVKTIEKHFMQYNSKLKLEVERTDITIEYLQLQLKQFPVLFYLSGLFVVIAGGFVLTFFLAYYGNFFYRAYLFRNDGTPAQWRLILEEERNDDSRQPLLSISLNIILIVLLAYFLNQTSVGYLPDLLKLRF
ncbi:MAG: hypothetical protein IPM71_04230 [Bacteroidota bacterium]|nr:MAG: hypothetical protein IPM71_04230 [Bacteroidota bacterium]